MTYKSWWARNCPEHPPEGKAMKFKFVMCFLFVLLALGASAIQAAAPRYANKEDALDLAKVLDKSLFKSSLITSTFVQSVAPEQYLIKVVLENGAEQEWDLRQIRNWSREDSIVLQRNRVLLFPRKNTNEFVVFDKNAFTQKVLLSRIYTKKHKAPDILAGQEIHYALFEFNLTDLLNLAPGTDELGYPFRYVLDLANGQREQLSYIDAYEVLQRGGLTLEPDPAQPVMDRPYLLQAVESEELELLEEGGLGNFGVKLTFDREITLQPEHFPFQLYETQEKAGDQKERNTFVIEFTAPNAVLPAKQPGTELGDYPISNLEYLQEINLVSDPDHQNRVLLRAKVNPDVLVTPPMVKIEGNFVTMVFSKVEDQSIFDRAALEQAVFRRKQDNLLSPEMTEEEVEKRRGYLEAMDSGTRMVERVRSTSTVGEKFQFLLTAMQFFRSASANASNDQELTDALRERNILIARIPVLVLDHVTAQLQSGQREDIEQLRKMVEVAAGLTQEPAQRRALQMLHEQLGQP